MHEVGLLRFELTGKDRKGGVSSVKCKLHRSFLLYQSIVKAGRSYLTLDAVDKRGGVPETQTDIFDLDFDLQIFQFRLWCGSVA